MVDLCETRWFLDQILAGIGQPFYVLDRDFRFTSFNEDAARYFGRPAGEMLGQVLWEVFPGEAQHERGRILREAMASRQVTRGEVPSLMASRLVSYSVFPLGNGLGVVFHDVSDRRDAQEALRMRTATLEAVLDMVPTAVWFTQDTEVRTVARNRRAAELLRIPPAETTPLAVVPHATFRFQREGRNLSPQELPLRRAARGETVDGEIMELVHDNGDRRLLLTRAVPLRAKDGAVTGAVCAAADVTERHRYEAQLKLLLDELNHRVKNMLTVVQSISALTLKDVDAAAHRAFDQRLIALGGVYSLLSDHDWTETELREVLRAVTRPLGAENRVIMSGDRVVLQPKAALTLSLAMHELATNAIKYGALSVAKGQVKVDWVNGPDRFRLTWQEIDGPAVSPPARQGFGTRMIQGALAAELQAEVILDYRPHGFACTIVAPPRDIDGMQAL